MGELPGAVEERAAQRASELRNGCGADGARGCGTERCCNYRPGLTSAGGCG
jgi:hypothetical protein